ncbi:MAG: 4Fe-4S dicluster domain-containing protein [Ruminococcaceae bacterium]|nr:4Fe-4S dicluster domain-containing protein [Oscillospiraceae bacterium]
MNNKNELRREQILRMSGVNPRKCMKCGKCTATCPSFDEMEYHPHEFVYMVESGEIEPLIRSESLYKCLTCFACVEKCPRSVEPAKLIEAVRNVVIREKGGARLPVDAIPAQLDDDMPQQLLMAALRKYSK